MPTDQTATDLDRTDLPLFAHLEAALDAAPCDHALTNTRRWAGLAGHPEGVVVHLVELHGGFCDCEVLRDARPRILGIC